MTNAIRSLDARLDVRVELETMADAASREALLNGAFGPARFAKTCERLRAGRAPARGLSLVARAGDIFERNVAEKPGATFSRSAVIGTVRLWHVAAGGVPALMLGPLAVARSHRDAGLGGLLMREALARAAALGHRAIILVGDAPYYARFGFSRDVVAGLAMPGPVEIERFLGLELVPGALAQAKGLVIATGEKAPRRRAVTTEIRRAA
jgi:predicted N-acetyltransferase YhbS